MRLIEDGIRCNRQPPQDDCCNQPAHNYIVIYGEKQWLCGEHYDEQMETRGFLHEASCIWMAKIWTRRGSRYEATKCLSFTNKPVARSAAPHSARHNVATLSVCSEPQIKSGLLPPSDCGSSLSFFDLRPYPFLEVRSVRIRNRIVFVLQLGTLFEEVPNTFG